jgi:hypothetical protein
MFGDFPSGLPPWEGSANASSTFGNATTLAARLFKAFDDIVDSSNLAPAIHALMAACMRIRSSPCIEEVGDGEGCDVSALALPSASSARCGSILVATQSDAAAASTPPGSAECMDVRSATTAASSAGNESAGFFIASARAQGGEITARAISAIAAQFLVRL